MSPKMSSYFTGILIIFWYLIPENWFEVYTLEILDSWIYGCIGYA